jgi:hypothetical protein
MASRRWWTTLGAIGLAFALALPVMAQGRGGGNGGGGGGKKDPDPVWARQVSIDDAASAQLESDGRLRLEDGTLGYATAGDPVVYQDHRVVHVDDNMMPVGPWPDRCVGVRLNDKQFDFDQGADPYLRNCNEAFPADGRTVTLVFLPEEPLDVNDPVHTVCDQFAYLIETAPVDTWGPAFPSQWQTGFEWIDPGDTTQGCRLTPAPGPVITDPGAQRRTGNVQFWADPWETEKVRGKVVQLTEGNLNVNFVVDRQFPGVNDNYWQVRSQQWDLPITVDPSDPTNDNARMMSADEQLFDLCLAGQGCVAFGFKLPLRIIYRRFEVAQ